MGAGKSSLLKSLLGELTVLEGSYKVHGSIAYVPQEAFLVNDTLRNNILFGKPYDKNKYEKVIKISQLRPDLEMLADGDMTEIGERGLNLSGGQKQRISIARAIYSDSDIYLVDDCLSALDNHVGGAILEQVFFGLLKGKTIVMSTHRHHFLDRVDQIYVLEKGEVVRGGEYEEIRETAEFTKLVEMEKELSEMSQKKVEESKMIEKKMKSLINLSKNSSEKQQEDELEVSILNEELPRNKEQATRKGAINIKSFLFYFSRGGVGLSALVFSLFTISIFLSVFSDWWAGAWIASTSTSSSSDISFILVYIFLILVGAAVYIVKFYLIGNLSCKASFSIFSEMFWNVLRRRTSFFDATPSGAIISRCIDDMEIVDYEYALIIKDVSETFFVFLGALVASMLGSLVVVFVILVVIILIIYCFLRYIKSSVDLKRLYRASRSGVLNCASEISDGYSSIRVYNYEKTFIEKWRKAHNLSIRTHLHEVLAKYALMLQFFGLTFILITMVCFIFFAKRVAGMNFVGGINTASLALINAFSINILIFLLSTKFGDMINNTGVVERLEEYCSWTEFEAELDKPEVMKAWPTVGQILIKDYSLKYRAGLPFVIQGLSFEVEGGTKVGVVGRTGSGKSTLLLGLTRILEAVDDDGQVQGSIEIDGIDIGGIGLHVLRRNITVIPQDPILLEGTLRSNLDPFGLYSDTEMLSILEAVNLSTSISGGDLKDENSVLDYKIEQRGANLSLGQRQLVCIARALVCKPKILLMDEATASIDQKTDRVIQNVIKHQMDGVTVITIAHRLDTIIQYDKILVLGDGRKLEEGAPSDLLRNQEGQFYWMVKEAGEEELQRMIYFSQNKDIDLMKGE